MQLNALQSGGCSDESGQLRRSSRTARTAVEPRHAWMLLPLPNARSNAAGHGPALRECVQAAVEPRHAWMLFADTQQTQKSRRARPGATGMRTETQWSHAMRGCALQIPNKRRKAAGHGPALPACAQKRSRATPCVDALCSYPSHAAKPPVTARRYRHAHRDAVEPRHAWMLFADTQQTQKGRRPRPGATVERHHAPPPDIPQKTSGRLSAA